MNERFRFRDATRGHVRQQFFYIQASNPLVLILTVGYRITSMLINDLEQLSVRYLTIYCDDLFLIEETL